MIYLKTRSILLQKLSYGKGRLHDNLSINIEENFKKAKRSVVSESVSNGHTIINLIDRKIDR